MKRTKRHTGYRRYANLSWWQWMEINENRERELRLVAKDVAEKVRQDVKEILEKYSLPNTLV